MFFSILGVAFAVPLLCYFQKLQLLVAKKIWNNFCCILLLFVWVQKVCLTFLISYFKSEILMFLSFVVSSLVNLFSQKTHFLTKKTSAVKSETHFSKEAIDNWRGKVLKENSITGRNWSSAKLFIMQTTLITLMGMCF